MSKNKKSNSRSLYEALAAVLTDIGSLLGVNSEVSLEVPRTDEPLTATAILANVGPLFRVCSHVYLGRGGSEH